MIKMRLEFYLEESGVTRVEFARLCGTTKQNINYWLKHRDVWVFCTEDHAVSKVEAKSRKVLWTAEPGRALCEVTTP